MQGSGRIHRDIWVETEEELLGQKRLVETPCRGWGAEGRRVLGVECRQWRGERRKGGWEDRRVQRTGSDGAQ